MTNTTLYRDWDKSKSKFKNPLCLRPFNSVYSETRPQPPKSGLEIKTDLEYYSTISRWLDGPSKSIAVCQGITSTKQINSRRVLSPAEPVGKSNSYQGQSREEQKCILPRGQPLVASLFICLFFAPLSMKTLQSRQNLWTRGTIDAFKPTVFSLVGHHI